MRIAVTGTHRVGKTTLAGAIADELPDHLLIDEPWHDLVGQGHLFSHPPTARDFEDQLEYALRSLDEDESRVVFDRCPLDLLAYLMVVSGDPDGAVRSWGERVEAAINSLDSVIHVPIESPDRIDVGGEDDPTALRALVDETVRELLRGDWLDPDVEVVEVHGSPGRRRELALVHLTGAPPRSQGPPAV